MLTIEVAYPLGTRFLSLPTALARQNRRTTADSLLSKLFPATEGCELEKHAHVHKLCSESFQQCCRGGDGSSGGEHVIYDEYTCPCDEGIRVHGEGRSAVFEIEGFA